MERQTKLKYVTYCVWWQGIYSLSAGDIDAWAKLPVPVSRRRPRVFINRVTPHGPKTHRGHTIVCIAYKQTLQSHSTNRVPRPSYSPLTRLGAWSPQIIKYTHFSSLNLKKKWWRREEITHSNRWRIINYGTPYVSHVLEEHGQIYQATKNRHWIVDATWLKQYFDGLLKALDTKYIKTASIVSSGTLLVSSSNKPV